MKTTIELINLDGLDVFEIMRGPYLLGPRFNR